MGNIGSGIPKESCSKFTNPIRKSRINEKIVKLNIFLIDFTLVDLGNKNYRLKVSIKYNSNHL